MNDIPSNKTISSIIWKDWPPFWLLNWCIDVMSMAYWHLSIFMLGWLLICSWFINKDKLLCIPLQELSVPIVSEFWALFSSSFWSYNYQLSSRNVHFFFLSKQPNPASDTAISNEINHLIALCIGFFGQILKKLLSKNKSVLNNELQCTWAIPLVILGWHSCCDFLEWWMVYLGFWWICTGWGDIHKNVFMDWIEESMFGGEVDQSFEQDCIL